MSSSQSFTYEVNRDTLPNGYASKDSGITINPSDLSADNCAKFEDVKSAAWIYLNADFKSHLFPNATASPTSISWSSKHRRSGVMAGKAYITLKIGTSTIWTSAASQSRNSDTSSSSSSSASAVTSTVKSTDLAIGGYATSYSCFLRWISFTFNFTRYDFSAIAGSNVASASVSSSTGYDGDTITYSCVLASGATFNGWYNGSTRVSQLPTYTHTVNGADLTLTAKATAEPTPAKHRYILYGSDIKYSDYMYGSLSVDYGSTNLCVISDGSKTLNCKNKLMSDGLAFNTEKMKCNGYIMTSNVVVMLCNGSWESGKGLVSGTGTLSDASGFITTPYLKMAGGRINVTIYHGGTRSGSCLNEYDSNLGYLSYWGQSSTSRTFTLDNSSTQYIRATFLLSALANCYIYDNTNGVYIFKGANVT